MSLSCSKCQSIIADRQYLSCADCKNIFDLYCANKSEKLYYLMDLERKASWKCSDCIHGHHSSKNPHPSTRDQDAYVSDQENVTFRRKHRANVTTENSFDSLSLDEDADDPTIILEGKCNLNRSCPTIRADNIYRMEELQKKILELSERLVIAENEITNLLTENCCLRKQISSYDARVNQLKDICRSTPRKSQRRSRNSLNKTKLLFSPERNSPSQHKDPSDKCPRPSGIQENDVEPTAGNFPISTDTTKKGNIYILGDEQVRGLSSRLHSAKFGQWNEKYNIQGLVKPHSSSNLILSNLDNLILTAKEGDIVIISVGKHDNNPILLLKNLYNTLNQLKKCKVLLLNIPDNRNLHVNRLNYELNMLIKNFKNCSILEVKDMFKKYSPKTNLDLIMFRINLEMQSLIQDKIDQIEIECKYVRESSSNDNEGNKFFRVSNFS